VRPERLRNSLTPQLLMLNHSQTPVIPELLVLSLSLSLPPPLSRALALPPSLALSVFMADLWRISKAAAEAKAVAEAKAKADAEAKAAAEKAAAEKAADDAKVVSSQVFDLSHCASQ
jgi:hypothetical protein